ncbi:MAG TPA: hypothetical protein VGD74_07300 [Vulgatibacter sp.]
MVRGDNIPRIHDRSYLDALEQATRYDSCYEGFDARAFFAVTFESDEFRRARAIATARMLRMERVDEEALLAREADEGARFLDFTVGVYTPQPAWTVLGAKNSIWRIEVPRVDAAPVLPLSIERIERSDANLQALYPYLYPAGAAYRLRFPRTDEQGFMVPGLDTPELALRIASAICRLEPAWRVAPAP